MAEPWWFQDYEHAITDFLRFEVKGGTPEFREDFQQEMWTRSKVVMAKFPTRAAFDGDPMWYLRGVFAGEWKTALRMGNLPYSIGSASARKQKRACAELPETTWQGLPVFKEFNLPLPRPRQEHEFLPWREMAVDEVMFVACESREQAKTLARRINDQVFRWWGRRNGATRLVQKIVGGELKYCVGIWRLG